ncbi:DUF7946 domain-containing protein [Succinatimonas hippei]|uniref:Uncharacterized protein n=1 Tax=Succinatimonas hippei (strain DSM 22608 / JCM 16073 / KCTC 15190 / YIT 12066) TaxID=762983 RepID=E8LIC7_SUCHY|nr:hypothetical protein [Succinatimonas hippei]EFY07716.1 hypothetical protein HMPREF9444_00444 [Succinatimonas hippei YIT 12066]
MSLRYDKELLTFTLKYEDLIEGDHEIELSSLAISLQGFAKICSAVGSLSTLNYYEKDPNKRNIKVTTCAKLTPGSIDILITIKNILSSSDFWSGGGPALILALFSYIFNRNTKNSEELKNKLYEQNLEKIKKEMYEYEYANTKRIQDNEVNIENIRIESQKRCDDLQKQIDILTEQNIGACKYFADPLGKQCKKISAHLVNGNCIFCSNSSFKDFLYKPERTKFLEPRKYNLYIKSLDKENGTGQARIDNINSRLIDFVIVDPELHQSGNIYASSFIDFDKNVFIHVLAKAEMTLAGELKKLHILSTLKSI